MNSTTKTFLDLLQSGLWDKVGKGLNLNEGLDWNALYQMASEQGTIGLIAAGIERTGILVPLTEKLQIVGELLQIEQRNKGMNAFVGELVATIGEAGILALLVKGQGVAQCYEKPFWRPAGDIDLFVSGKDYEKTIEHLRPMAESVRFGGRYSKETGVYIDQWHIEVHGTLRDCLSTKIDKEIDAVQKEIFENKRVRVWKNAETDVLLPRADEDVFLVFVHFLKHFYKEGLGLRQVCDWCRLLWTYRGELNYDLLESRIRKAGLIGEWKTFAAVAVDYLGMDENAIPMYSPEGKWHRKAYNIIAYLLRKGSRHDKKDIFEIGRIFPTNTARFATGILFDVNWLKVKERLIPAYN